MNLIGYVTLEEANEYIKTHYLSTDSLRVLWEGLTDNDRTVLLNKSFQGIELLPFTGRKAQLSQSKAFPRWPYEEVPSAVKFAQIEEAVAMSDASAEEDFRHYSTLRSNGVSSYTIGNLSESLSASTGTGHATVFRSALAERLLRPFLGGGYRM